MIVLDGIVVSAFTANLGAFGWIIKELADIKQRLARIEARCPYCEFQPKPTMKKTALLILPLIALCTLTGCAGFSPFVKHQEVRQDVVSLPPRTVTTTNDIPTASVVLDPQGTPTIVTNMVHNVVSTVVPGMTVTNYSTNTVYAVNPMWESSISGAQAINQVANPTPFAPLVNIALGGLAAVLGLIVRAKNKELTAGGAVLSAVIDGVEKANSQPVKDAIKSAATAAGVLPDLHAAVQERT